jgi:hypothetical protein
MSALLHQRCFHHPGREAAARCASCKRFYCRECVTEHGQRMMCAACVARLGDAVAVKRSRGVLWALSSTGGLLLAWLIFYYLGRGLANIPASFHVNVP